MSYIVLLLHPVIAFVAASIVVFAVAVLTVDLTKESSDAIQQVALLILCVLLLLDDITSCLKRPTGKLKLTHTHTHASSLTHAHAQRSIRDMCKLL